MLHYSYKFVPQIHLSTHTHTNDQLLIYQANVYIYKQCGSTLFSYFFVLILVSTIVCQGMLMWKAVISDWTYTNCSFQSDLFNKSADPVHKHSFTNQISNSTQWYSVSSLWYFSVRDLKYLLLCSTEKILYRFGTTWRWDYFHFWVNYATEYRSFLDLPPSGCKWCNSSHSTLAGSALRSDCQPVKRNINSVTTQTTQTVNNTQGSRLARHTLPQMNANITLHCHLVHKIDFHGMSGHVSSSPKR